MTAAAARVPVVQVDRFVSEARCDYVGVDRGAGITAAAAHLRAMGCRRLAFVSAQENTTSAHDRAQAFRQATPDAQTSDMYLGEFSLDWGRQAASMILTRRPMPDGIVCGADILALGVVAGLTEAGIRIPHDVRVTGFDDIGFAQISHPPLTTVRQPATEIATEAVLLLLRRLDGDHGAPQHRVLQPELVVRGSTLAPGGRTPA